MTDPAYQRLGLPVTGFALMPFCARRSGRCTPTRAPCAASGRRGSASTGRCFVRIPRDRRRATSHPADRPQPPPHSNTTPGRPGPGFPHFRRPPWRITSPIFHV